MPHPLEVYTSLGHVDIPSGGVLHETFYISAEQARSIGDVEIVMACHWLTATKARAYQWLGTLADWVRTPSLYELAKPKSEYNLISAEGLPSPSRDPAVQSKTSSP